MLKKGIAAAALIAATSSIYAGGPEAPPPAYIGGAYVDVGLSRDDIYNNFQRNISTFTSTDIQGVTVTGTRNFAYRINAGAPGWDGFVGAGYTYVWDNEWTLGLEMFGDVSSASGRQFTASQVNLVNGYTNLNYVGLRAKYSLGLSLMPGYFIAPGSLYFLELGYVNTEFGLTGFPAPAAGALGNNVSLDSWLGANPGYDLNRSGFRLGFGTNTQVGSHVAIREEYVWETYGNFTASRNFSRTNETLTSTNANNNAIRVSPSISKFNLAAVYYFARQGNAPDLNAAPAHVGGNFYAGLNGSYDEFYSHADAWQTRSTLTANDTGFIVSDDTSGIGALMKGQGWNIGLIGGYGWNFTNRWYMGAELFGNYDNANSRATFTQGSSVTNTNGVVVVGDNAASISSRLQKRWDFGAALIPGYQVSDAALLYARVGYVGADFNIRSSWSGTTGLTVAQNALASFSRTNWLGGLQLGIGVDTLVYENLSLRTEFNINNYRNFSASGTIDNTTADGQTRVRTVSVNHRHIIEDQFNLALIWHFFG